MSYIRRERTFWRDAALSFRHGLWGYNCPATDLDFVLIENDTGKVVALIEYKHHYAIFNSIIINIIKKLQQTDFEITSEDLKYGSSYIAISRLGTEADKPVFIVKYHKDFDKFLIIPFNNIGSIFLRDFKNTKQKLITEKEYVTFLYKLRNRSVDKDVQFTSNGKLIIPEDAKETMHKLQNADVQF